MRSLRALLGGALCCLVVVPLLAVADDGPHFEGGLRNLDDPVTLRYRSVEGFRVHLVANMKAQGSSSRTATVSIVIEGATRARGLDLEWDMKVWTGANTRDPEGAGEPVFVVMQTGDRGAVSSIRLSGPDPETGRPLRAGMPAYERSAADMMAQARPLPTVALNQGDDMFASIPKRLFSRRSVRRRAWIPSSGCVASFRA